ncbi:MAG: hypothetical protein ACHQDD_09525, partial [Steroidobacterales bacterium]
MGIQIKLTNELKTNRWSATLRSAARALTGALAAAVLALVLCAAPLGACADEAPAAPAAAA